MMEFTLLGLFLVGLLLLVEFLTEYSLTYLILSVAVMLLSVITMIEWLWVGLIVFWMIRLTWKAWPSGWMVLPALVGALILGAHGLGWKFYGSPVLLDNQPLIESALILKNIKAPNILVATDGREYELKGAKFRSEISPESLSMKLEDLRRYMGLKHFRFTQDSAYPSGYAGEKRLNYSCGNTWFCCFLPRRLPKYELADVTEMFKPIIASKTESL
jgi:hypothetical protein